jgi:hypothetical protein
VDFGRGERQFQLLILGGGLAALGLVVLLWAFYTAREGSTSAANRRSSLWGSVGSGLFMGAAVSVGLQIVQVQLARDAEEPTWRANVQAASSIPGFSIPHFDDGHEYRPINDINFSGKDLHNADLTGVNLTNVNMRDTNLRGAILTDADLTGANLIGANLENARLTRAHLANAKLQATNFRGAEIEFVADLNGAIANDKTCWTRAFLVTDELLPRTDGIRPAEGQGSVPPEFQRGRMDPDCLPRSNDE